MKKIGFNSAKINFNTILISANAKKKYENNKKLCLNCKNELIYENRKNKFCSRKCQLELIRKDIPEKRLYKLDCRFKFNLADYKEEFNFELIKKHGWYAPTNSKAPNLNGISRDHMFSIDEGFKNNIKPELIAHPANCKLVSQRENSSKYKKSSITLEELKIKIENWNKKYGNT